MYVRRAVPWTTPTRLHAEAAFEGARLVVAVANPAVEQPVEEIVKALPRRWRLYVVDLEPRVGTRPGKQRRCVAIQPTEFGEAGLESTVVLPLTTKIVREDAFPLRVRIPAGTAGVDRDSDVLVDQILAWDNALFRRELGELPEALQEAVRQALREFLDL